jgi:hypothetical protein
VEDWGKLLGDTAAAGSMLDRRLHHGHVLKCGPLWLHRFQGNIPQGWPGCAGRGGSGTSGGVRRFHLATFRLVVGMDYFARPCNPFAITGSL